MAKRRMRSRPSGQCDAGVASTLPIATCVRNPATTASARIVETAG
jgi:hypothetical protein